MEHGISRSTITMDPEAALSGCTDAVPDEVTSCDRNVATTPDIEIVFDEDDQIETNKLYPKNTPSPTDGLEISSMQQQLPDRFRSSKPSRHRVPPQELLNFNDHFTIRRRSSRVTFEGDFVYLYDLRTSQMQIKISDPEASHATRTGTTRTEGNTNANDTGIQRNATRSRTHIGNQANAAVVNDVDPCSDTYKLTREVEIKNVPHDRSEQLSVLRLMYTIVAFFCMATVSFVVEFGVVGQLVGSVFF